MTNFKISLAAARVNAGLTQKEAAEKLDVKMDDFYKTCRWCRWNKNGECRHSGTFAVDSLKAECKLDDGIIYEAVTAPLQL